MQENNYYLYRVYDNGEAKIYGKFNSLSAATLSAKLLLINNMSFITNEDLSKVYFYNTDNIWELNALTEEAKKTIFSVYPLPSSYK